MKTIKLIAGAALLSLLAIIGCQKSSDLSGTNESAGKRPPSTPPVNCTNPYVITLESKTLVNGNWEWVWSVYNPNPGNGSGGTAQNLSHWGLLLGQCVDFSDIVDGATSTDGTTWTPFTPTNEVDPSQNCVTVPVLKFNVGTTGTDKTYYKLILDANYSVDPNAAGYFKSGANTGCCTLTYTGIGCPIDEWCALSQGYWFAKPELVWCQDVTFGANSYTQAQGQEIWNTAPPTSVAKKAFTQASALQLSMACQNGGDPIPADILSAYNTLVNFLSGLTYNDILTGAYPASDYPAIAAAQGAIGAWIPLNHCEEEEEIVE
jgi:hypothetical protein